LIGLWHFEHNLLLNEPEYVWQLNPCREGECGEFENVSLHDVRDLAIVIRKVALFLCLKIV